MTAFPSYSTGTVAIGATATTVVGTGSNWTGQNAVPGDLLVVAGQSVIVQDVTDALHLAIDAWPFAAVTAGTAYKLYKVSPLRFAGGQAMADVSTLVSALNTDGFYVFVGPDLSVPDPSYGNDNQYAFQATTGKLWQKTGGVWNFVGTQKGFGVPAPWNSATAYLPFDVATLDGTSYVCILANTNETPSFGDSPPNTFWVVLAEKGETGAPGTNGTNGTNGTDGATGGTGPAAWTAPAAWVTGHAYVAGPPASVVVQGGETYVCLTSHTSGTFATDLAASKWIKVAQKGSGDMLASNNLSDVTNAATARANLGVPSQVVSGLNLNPTSTTNTADTMMGMGGTIKITPAVSTRIKITIACQLVSDHANGQVFSTIRYGTGTAPTNSTTPATGTAASTRKVFLAGVANQAIPISITAVVTGLTVGTAYWIDMAIAAGNVAGAGAFLQAVDYIVEEI